MISLCMFSVYFLKFINIFICVLRKSLHYAETTTFFCFQNIGDGEVHFFVREIKRYLFYYKLFLFFVFLWLRYSSSVTLICDGGKKPLPEHAVSTEHVM